MKELHGYSLYWTDKLWKRTFVTDQDTINLFAFFSALIISPNDYSLYSSVITILALTAYCDAFDWWLLPYRPVKIKPKWFEFHIKASCFRCNSLDLKPRSSPLRCCLTEITTGKNLEVEVVFLLAVLCSKG